MPVYVNVNAANIYSENAYKSAIITQAVLWEEIQLLSGGSQFSRIRCEDNYEGWISNHQFCVNEMLHPLQMFTKILCPVFKDRTEKSALVRSASAGCYAPLTSIQKNWAEIILPDGQNGWVKSESFEKFNNNERRIIVSFSKQFLGVPYFWGGKTAAGIDCSGFVQLLHKLAGIKIRRDSIQQFEDAQPVSENINDGRPGDLLFFAEDGKKISHVAVRLEDNKIVHSRGMVRINSLNEKEALYDASLIRDFVAVKTFLN